MDGHISYAELSRFAQDKLAVPRERAEEIESHIANCAECGATFDFHAVAARRLRDVIAAFEGIGRVANVALAGIDLSEALLVLERWEEIVKVAAHAFRVLKKAGDVTGALTALAYLKEAAAKRQLTPDALKVVREYLRRVEREPDLLFAAPPKIPR